LKKSLPAIVTDTGKHAVLMGMAGTPEMTAAHVRCGAFDGNSVRPFPNGHRQQQADNRLTGETQMTSLGEIDLAEAAKRAAGNWQTLDSFVWWRATELDDADSHAIIYTHHRDSGLIDQSNAAVIAKALEPFTEGDDPDVTAETHSHWAVGHIDGFAIRVFRNGEVTDAFVAYHALAKQMETYPILDDSHYSEMEYEAAFENIDLAAWRVKRSFHLPKDWQSAVFDWLWQNRDSALENVDDQGGWPDESDLEDAFNALGYARAA
jgi:hypothetical protein